MKIEKVEQLVASLHDNKIRVIHIRNLKQALNHGLVLEKYIIQNNSVFGKAIAASAKSDLASLKAEVGKIDRPKVLIYIS